MVRTITHEDVNVTDAESLLSAGALDNQPRKKRGQEYTDRDIDGIPIMDAVSANREPVFKLAWAGFPDQTGMKLLATATDGEPVSNATMEYAERNETLLLVLGGQGPNERPGINVLQLPAYTPPPPAARKGSTPANNAEGMALPERYAYRDSLAPTGSSNYPTRTPPGDFILIPRTSPHFALSHDPIAIVVTLGPEKSQAPIKVPHASRGFESWAFPPPRSSIVPPVLGRKNFLQPGQDAEKLVAMTPAPVLARTNSPRQGSSWRLPWSPTGSPSLAIPPSPSGSMPSPSLSAISATSQATKRLKIRRRYRIPAGIWTGGVTVMGCEMYSLPTPTFKRLINWSIEIAGDEDVPRLPLRGGMAVPDLQSPGAPDVKVAKLESYRILATWHADCTVRFWDVSPHILLLPTPLRFEYPSALPHLTISLAEWLTHHDVLHLPLAKLWANERHKVKISSVHLAREALECVITMASGEVIVTKFGQHKAGAEDDTIEELDAWNIDSHRGPGTPQSGYSNSPKTEYFPRGAATSLRDDWVEEIAEIGHLAKWHEDGFKPVAIVTVKRGEAIVCAVSDIGESIHHNRADMTGFIAVAFATKSLAILDMRGPDVILREGFDEDGAVLKKKKKKGNVQNVVGEKSEIGAMKWVVSGMGNGESRLSQTMLIVRPFTTASTHRILCRWVSLSRSAKLI